MKGTTATSVSRMRALRRALEIGRRQWGSPRPLGLSIAALLALAAFILESGALWALAGLCGVLQLLGTIRAAQIWRVVQTASTAGVWLPARLSHEELSGEWVWKMEVQGTSSRTLWASPTGDFRDELPLDVEVCEQGAEGVVVRYGERLLLTSVLCLPEHRG